MAAWKEAQTYGTMTEGPWLDPVTMFDDVYAEVPAHLASQRRRLLEVAPTSNQCVFRCPTTGLDGDVLFCRLRCCNCGATEIQSVARLFGKTQLAMTSIISFVTAVHCIRCLVVTVAATHLMLC